MDLYTISPHERGKQERMASLLEEMKQNVLFQRGQ